MRRFHPPPPPDEEVVFPEVLVLLERRSSSARQPEMVVIMAAMCNPTPAHSSHHLPELGIMAVCFPRRPVVVLPQDELSKEDPPDTVLMVQLDIACVTEPVPPRGNCAMSTEQEGTIDIELECTRPRLAGATGADRGRVEVAIGC